MQFINKRRFVRLNVLPLIEGVFVQCRYLEKERASLIKDISKGGICLILYEEVKSLDVLDLKISLPDEKNPINAIGRVCWVKEIVVSRKPKKSRFEVGVEFIEIDKEDRKKIANYIMFIIQKELKRLEKEEGITAVDLAKLKKQAEVEI